MRSGICKSFSAAARIASASLGKASAELMETPLENVIVAFGRCGQPNFHVYPPEMS
jgi:hypothetical protein